MTQVVIEALEIDEAARQLLDGFGARFEGHWIAAMRPKLGLTRADDGDVALAQALFHAHWGEGRDLGAAEAVAAVAAGLGIARDDLLAAVADQRIGNPVHGGGADQGAYAPVGLTPARAGDPLANHP